MIGDKLTIVHPCGARAAVILTGLDERKMRARIVWPLAGGYDIDLSNGHIRDKKAQLWHLTDECLKQLVSLISTKIQEKEKGKST